MAHGVAELGNKRCCGSACLAETDGEKAGKGERKCQDKEGVDEPVTGRAFVVVAAIVVVMAKVGADCQKKKCGHDE